MKDKRLLQHNPDTGVSEWFIYDHADDSITLQLTQPTVSDDLNAVEYNAAPDYGPSRWKGEFHKVASIPLVEYVRLQREGVIAPDGEIRDDKKLLKLLNDRDYLKFRTKPGAL